MTHRAARNLMFAANTLALVASLALALHVVVLADPMQRNVGPVVAYTAYALLTLASAQVVSLALWWTWRRNAPVRGSLRVTWAACTTASLAVWWFASTFAYRFG